MIDCVLKFVITHKTKEEIIGYFHIVYYEGDNQISTKDMQWSSMLSQFPPNLNEYCVEVNNKKVCPKRIKIWEKIVEYKNVTEDYINE